MLFFLCPEKKKKKTFKIPYYTGKIVKKIVYVKTFSLEYSTLNVSLFFNR